MCGVMCRLDYNCCNLNSLKTLSLIVLHFVLVFQVSPLIAQTKPEDVKPEPKSNVFVYCIKGWQYISYKTPLLDCQFDHNCSQYAIDSITSNGMFLGTLQTTNRLIRCNPLARYCYKEKHGSLIDDSELVKLNYRSLNSSSKLHKPVLFSSSLIPGLNKLWVGKWSDAVFTASIVTFGIFRGRQKLEAGKNIRAGIVISMASIVYISDVYWSLTQHHRDKSHPQK